MMNGDEQREQDESVVYLIHFDQPYQHARHYLGTARNLEQRLRQHRCGSPCKGARLLEVVMQAGISWRVVRTWKGGRELEWQLKNQHNGVRLCPVCKVEKISRQAESGIVAELEDDNLPLWQ